MNKKALKLVSLNKVINSNIETESMPSMEASVAVRFHKYIFRRTEETLYRNTYRSLMANKFSFYRMIEEIEKSDEKENSET